MTEGKASSVPAWHGLPDHPPAPALRWRVLIARQRQLRWRKMRRVAGASALVLVLGLMLSLPQGWTPSSEPIGIHADALAALTAQQDESRILEREWRQEATPTDPTGSPSLMLVRSIDARLQSAYERGAESRELSRLWRQRNQHLRALIVEYRNAGKASSPAHLIRL